MTILRDINIAQEHTDLPSYSSWDKFLAFAEFFSKAAWKTAVSPFILPTLDRKQFTGSSWLNQYGAIEKKFNIPGATGLGALTGFITGLSADSMLAIYSFKEGVKDNYIPAIIAGGAF